MFIEPVSDTGQTAAGLKYAPSIDDHYNFSLDVNGDRKIDSKDSEALLVELTRRFKYDSEKPFGMTLVPLNADLREKYAIIAADGLVVTGVSFGSIAYSHTVKDRIDLVGTLIKDYMVTIGFSSTLKSVTSVEDFKMAMSETGVARQSTVSGTTVSLGVENRANNGNDFTVLNKRPRTITISFDANMDGIVNLADQRLLGFRIFPPIKYQNPINQFDVNADRNVNPLDSLLILNKIAALNRKYGQNIPSQLSDEDIPQNMFYDVNGDGAITPLDSLMILSEIARANRENGN